MSDTPRTDDQASPEHSAGIGEPAPGAAGRPGRRKRRAKRIALLSAISVLVLLGGVMVGGYLAVNNLAGHIRRIPVQFTRLDAADRLAGGPASGRGMTVLITGQDTAGSAPELSGLVMLLHINAGQSAGGVVSIPPGAVVSVPGHGRQELWNTLVLGGPSLLVQTVQSVTHVQIDHFARIDFAHVANVVNAVGGVDVTLPEQTASFGHIFPAGTSHVFGATALSYARQPSLTEEGRVLRQQSLIRAVMRKLAGEHLLTSPATMFHVLSALTQMLTVDSTFSNSELQSLAMELGGLSSSAGTFVTAPAHLARGHVVLDTTRSDRLWAAIRQDAIAAFAAKHPATVTSAAPR